jgi:hypothetical protein
MIQPDDFDTEEMIAADATEITPIALATYQNEGEFDIKNAARHQCIALRDAANQGVQKVRNRLTEHADDFGHQAWRILDCPDDRFTDEIFRLKVEDDVVWFPYRTIKGSGSRDQNFNGDPIAAMFVGVAPWMFAARSLAMRENGIVWRESAPCRHGSWIWFDMLQGKLRFRYCPTIGYIWNRDRSVISNQEVFRAESLKFFNEAWYWVRQEVAHWREYQHLAERTIARYR